MTTNGSIAARLRTIVGITQKELSIRVGTSIMSISRFERGLEVPVPVERIIFEELDLFSKRLPKEKKVYYLKTRNEVDEYWIWQE